MTNLCISLKIYLHVEPRSTQRDLFMSTLQPSSYHIYDHIALVDLITLVLRFQLPSKRSILECFLFIFLATILDPQTAHLFPMVDYPRIHPVCPHLVMLREDGNIPKRLHIFRFIQWLGLCLGVSRGDLVNQLKVSQHFKAQYL